MGRSEASKRIVLRLLGACLLMALLVATAGLPSAWSASVLMTMPDRFQLLAQPRQRDFAALERELTGYQQAFEANDDLERPVWYAFSSFATLDPALEPILSEWVDTYPQSYAARLARAEFSQHMACIIAYCGPGSAPEQSRQQQLQAEAEADLEKAVALHPRLAVAHAQLIRQASRDGDGHAFADRVKTALRVVPTSTSVYAAYLAAFRPDDGEALDRLTRLLQELELKFQGRPKFSYLAGYRASVIGDLKHDSGDCAGAIDEYSNALKYTDDPDIIGARAFAYYCTGNYAAGLADSNRAIEQLPADSHLLAVRGLIYLQMQKTDEAIADLTAAVQLDPYEPRILLDLTDALMYGGHIPEARQSIDRALVFGASIAEIQAERAELYRMSDPKIAEDAYAKATALDPDNRQYLEDYIAFQERTGNCKIFDTIKQYRAICARASGCQYSDSQLDITVRAFEQQRGSSCASETWPAARDNLPMPD